MSVWMAETLLATTLLMALVMLVRRPVARYLGAGAAYWLWLLPLVRMVLPALPQDMVTPSPLHAAVDQAGLPALLAQVTGQDFDTTAPVQAAFPWLELAVGVWIAGAVLFVAVQAIGYIRFRHLILKDATPIGEEGRLCIIASPRISGPLAFGVFKPHIVLPADFALRFDSQEQDMAIAHERAHHDYGDLVANMVALVLLALHWCNPVAWIAYRAYRADQELACDARVLSLYGQENAHAYGRAILKAAGGRQFAAVCHLTRLTTLKGRLKMLSSHDVSLRRITLGMAVVGMLTIAGLALTASGSRAAQQVAAITETMQGVKLARLADFISEPAVASTIAVPQASEPPPPPVASEAMVAAADRAAAEADRAAALADKAAAVVPPAPPYPPVPSVPQVRTEKNHIFIVHPDGRKVIHSIPSEAEIRRMTPDIDVAEGCEGGEQVSRRETVDTAGRRHIRMRICQRMTEERAQAGALQGLKTARDTIARTVALSEKTRTEILADLDDEIADLRLGRN